MNRGAFDGAFAFVVGIEGKETDDPNDPGGYTKFGIAQNKHPDIDVRSMTLDDAQAFYRRTYWNPMQCDAMHPTIGTLLFDSAVNQGVSGATKIIQRALKITVDGALGPMTLRAINAQQPSELACRFLAVRSVDYTHDEGFARNGEGWLYRCFRLARAFP